MRTMDNIIPTDEYTEVENRVYANPQTSLDRSRNFIQNLRDTQAQQNQQIAQDTYNLGSALPSAQGGLGTNTPANMGYFTSRLQTPQTTSAVANLRATAQAAALNQALENEQEIWKKKYQDAYRKYQKSAYDKTNKPTTTDPEDTNKGAVDETTTDDTSTIKYSSSVGSVPGYYSVIDINGNVHLVDMETGEETVLPPEEDTVYTGVSGAGWSGGGSGGGSVGGR